MVRSICSGIANAPSTYRVPKDRRMVWRKHHDKGTIQNTTRF
jgi:hypothetical protein